MSDPRDAAIEALRRKLSLAFTLMTEFQRKRHQKLWMKHETSVDQESSAKTLKRQGRPREFKGHVPGSDSASARQEGTKERRFDVC